MTIQHASITDPDIHEIKGASSASAGTVPIADGSGNTSFGQYDYTNLKNKPAAGATAEQGAKADAALPATGGAMTGPIQLSLYTLTTLPDAVTYNRYLIVVSNATDGPALCISNGSNWINIRTNAIVA